MKNRHQDNHHGWIANSEQTMTTQEAGKLLSKLSEKVNAGGHFKLNSVSIAMPPQCHFVMRYERRPSGELVLKTEMIWSPHSEDSVSDNSFEITDAD